MRPLNKLKLCICIFCPFYTILESTKIDNKIKKWLKFEYSVDYKSLSKIYSRNPEIYIQFVERYNILTMMRWTISAACFINLVIDLIVMYKKDFHWQFLLTTIVFALGTILFYLLSAQTENDYANRIESLKDE
jgi:uncharacterized membrane protein YozB (DUF420 family)